jgi:hypothetical protein
MPIGLSKNKEERLIRRNRLPGRINAYSLYENKTQP